MISKRYLISSAGMTLLQVVVSAGVLYFLYRFLLDRIGVEGLGIWSLVLAATSLVRLSDLGMGGSVIRFVSSSLAQGDSLRASQVVQTSAIVVGTASAAALFCSHPVIAWGLGYFLQGQDLDSAIQILPYVLLAVWLSMVAGVFQSGLDGCQQIGVRNGFDIAANVLYLVAALVLVPKRGIVGLGMAQVLQAALLLLANWLALRRVLPLPWALFRFSRTRLAEIWGYSMHLQGIAVVALLIEPTTKALLGKFGGLAMVGYYDMAAKMLNQFRSLMVSVNLVLVPVIARLEQVSPSQVEPVYSLSYRIGFYLSVPLYAGLFAMLPALSLAWIGRHESTFVLSSMMMTVGMFLNSLVNPAYITNLGLGKLRQNLHGFLVMATLNAILGYILGRTFGGFGVVLASVIAMAIGSWAILLGFHLERNLPISGLFPRESAFLVIASLVGAAVALVAYGQLRTTWPLRPLLAAGACALIYFLATCFAMWMHPVRRELFAWLVRPASRPA
jgi:O-antigen/teichoic acid export membrane protein